MKKLLLEYVKFNVAGTCGFVMGTCSFFLFDFLIGSALAWFPASGVGGIVHFGLAHILLIERKTTTTDDDDDAKTTTYSKMGK